MPTSGSLSHRDFVIEPHPQERVGHPAMALLKLACRKPDSLFSLMKNHLTAAPQIMMKSRAELRQWLLVNHAQPTGVWLVINKKTSGLPHMDSPG